MGIFSRLLSPLNTALSLASWVGWLFPGLGAGVMAAWAASELTWFWNTFQWLGIIFVGLVTWLLVGIGLNLYRQSRTDGENKRLEPTLIIAAIAGVVLLGSLVVWSQKAKVSQSETLSTSTKNGPEYLKTVEFESSDQTPLIFRGVVSNTIERLRIIVEPSSEMTGHYFPHGTIAFGERKDLIRDDKFEVRLITKSERPDLTQAQFVWAAPGNRSPVRPLNRVRLSIIGPDGLEQHIYFMVVQAMPNLMFTPNPPLKVIPESDLQWINEWRAKDS